MVHYNFLFMKTSRRTFIRNSSLTIASAAILPNMLYAEKKKKDDIVGVQLYIVRKDMKDDPAGTLKKLKEGSYEYVEHDFSYPIKTRVLVAYDFSYPIKTRVLAA